MRKSLLIVAPLAMFALATVALAGGPDCDKHMKNAAAAGGCTMSKDECMKHMAEAKNSGWLGIRYDHTDDGASIVQEVVKGSPAERAGFQAGDVLYALNGIEMNEANASRVKSTWKALKPGSVANYTVQRAGVAKDLTVTLGKMPDEVYQAMVAEHMKEHVAIASN